MIEAFNTIDEYFSVEVIIRELFEPLFKEMKEKV